MASIEEELFELENQRRDLEAEIRQQAKEEEEERMRDRDMDAKGLATPNNKSTGAQQQLLHSGPMLGNLPSIAPRSASPQAHGSAARDLDDALKLSEEDRGALRDHEAGKFGSGVGGGNRKMAPKKAEGKQPKPKRQQPEVPKDMPPKYICQLSQQPMQQPVKSPYGHLFEKAIVMHWIEQQGRICPLTGAPLAEDDLQPQDDLQQEIVMWQLKRSSAPPVQLVTDHSGSGSGSGPSNNNQVDSSASAATGTTTAADTKDDLYDF
jgi:hypothetical protein